MMKKHARFLAMALAILMILPMLCIPTFAEDEVQTEDYGDYYYHYDFENYVNAGFTSYGDYFKSTTVTTADGKKCNNANEPGMVVISGGDSAIVYENGNAFLRQKFDKASSSTGARIGTFPIGKKVLGNSIAIDFKFRANGTESDSAQVNLLEFRRGASTSCKAFLKTDGMGRIYVYNVDVPVTNPVYTPDSGEFSHISVRWYDTTNTVSLYVNGEVIIESARFSTDYRDKAYVAPVWNDTFITSDLTLVNSNTGTVQLMNAGVTNISWSFDIDDIKMYQIATPEGLGYYYVNSFDGLNSITDLATKTDSNIIQSTYMFNSGNRYLVKAADADGNSYLKLSNGEWFGFADQKYQVLSASSWVLEFDLKNVSHAEVASDAAPSLLPIITYEDGGLGNATSTLYFDQNGNLYTSKDVNNIIPGVNVSGDEWTHISVVCVNDMTKNGSFGSFNSTTTASSVNLRRTFAFYVDGKFVGFAPSKDILTWNMSTGKRTLNGYDIASITDHTVDGTTVTALDTSKLTVVDNMSTANHTIFMSSDGLTYYDVEYTDSTKGTQKAYSVMTFTTKNVGGRGEYLGFFFTSRNSAAASVDNIRLYEGNYPVFMTENAVKEQDGTLLDVDFGSYTYFNHDKAVATGGNAKETATGEVYGIVVESTGFDLTKLVTRYDASGNAITSDYGNTEYVNMVMRNGFHDFFFPYSATGIYSFEHTVKNVVPDAAGKNISFFAIRRENRAGSKTSQPLAKAQLNEDGTVQLYTHYLDTNKGRPLYYKNGSPALLEGNTWQTIKVIYDESFKTNEAMPTVSFYLDGELLYLDKEGKSPAKDIPNVFNDVAANRYTPNQRIRYNYGDLSDGTLDIKSLTIKSVKPMETVMDKVDDSIDLKNKVTVIEAALAFTPYSAEPESFYPLVELNRTNENTTRGLALLYTNANDGVLYVKNTDGDYVALCDADNEPIVISENAETPTEAAIVYDDVTGLLRYYVDGFVPYVGEGNAASNMQAYDLDFYRLSAIEEGISVLKTTAEGRDASITVSAYNLNYSGTSEIVAIQESDDSTDIRLLAGIDSYYYGAAGFEFEAYVSGVSQGIKSVAGTSVFESIVADGETVVALDEYGYKYFSIAAITNVPQNIDENSYIIARPYTVVGGVKSYGDSVKIVILENGYGFDENYVATSVADNGEAFECSEIESFEGNGLAFNNQDAIFNFNATCSGKVYISLDSSRGLASVNESVFELTVDGETSEIRLPIGRNHVLLAEVEDGDHAFSLKKISGGDFVRINSVTINGVFTEPALTALENGVVVKVYNPTSGKSYGHVSVFVKTTDISGKYYIEYPFLYQRVKGTNPYEGNMSAGGNQQYNVDMYRTNKGFVTERDGDDFVRTHQVLQNGEIGVALREAKTSNGSIESNMTGDSIGGFHGDENITDIPVFSLDGRVLDITTAGTYTGTTLEFVQDSAIDRCNSTGETIILHKQICKIDTNGMRVKRSLEFLVSDYAHMKGKNYLQMFTFARQDLTRVLEGDYSTADLCNTVNLLDAAGNVLHTIDTETFTVTDADGTATTYGDYVKNGVIIQDTGFVGNDVNNRYAEYIGDNGNGIYAKVGFNITDASTKVESAYIRVRKGIFDPAQIDPESTTLASGVHGDNKWYPSFTSVNDPAVCLDAVGAEFYNNDTIWYPHAGETWNVDLLYYIDYAPTK